MRPYRWLAAVCFLGVSALAGSAVAGDIEDAAAFFTRGLEHMEAGRYDQGCPSLGESYTLDPRPGTLFTLAECEAKRGRTATALARYDEYLTLFAGLPPDKRAKQGDREAIAKAQRSALEREVPKLTLVLAPGAPAGTVIKRDGAVVAAATLGAPVSVDPGEHVVTTQAPGGAVTETRVTLGKSESRQATLEVKAPSESGSIEAPPPVGAPSDSGPSGQRVGAYAAGGIGIAGLVLGGIMGGLTLGKKGVITDHCMDTACDAEGLAAAESSKTLGLVSTIGFVVGAAGVGVGAVLLLTEPSPTPAANGMGRGKAGGRWVSAGVLAAGPDGATVGARGVW
jgi:hypothetical protein